jgi:M6 family metalloprotease-like protein
VYAKSVRSSGLIEGWGQFRRVSGRVRRWAAVAALAVMFATPHMVRAIPASPQPFEETQPDGAKITLYLRGDEHFNWVADSAGYTVVRNNGAFVYARLDDQGQLAATNLLVGKVDPQREGLSPRILPARPTVAAARSGLQPGAAARAAAGSGPQGIAARGTIKHLVVLMRFSNHTRRTLPSPEDISTIFNAVGGDPVLAPTGSVRDAYLENSYGVVQLESTVLAWVDLPQSEAYYANGNSGDSTYWEALASALDIIDPVVDFRQFDADDDGYIDAIDFLHSGYGAESGGTDVDGAYYKDRIWSHRWTMYPTWTSREGVKVSDYHTEAALWGLSGSAPLRIGVICHETGHFFGLPDLYDTDGTSEGVGSYCMMANSWGFDNSQLHPPHFSAWSKIFLGWITPTRIVAPGTYSVPQVETSPLVFRIDQGYYAHEYLLIENRQPAGIESDIPQGGLAIWHIDDFKDGNEDEGYPGELGWPQNGSHYQVALLQADGRYDLENGRNRGDVLDLYRAGGTSAIGPSTVPNTHAYRGGGVVATQNAITGVSAAAATMTFTFSGSFDCNHNTIRDDQDIVTGVSADCGSNGVPDECELSRVVPLLEQWPTDSSVAAQSFADAGGPEYSTKAWDDFTLARETAIYGGEAVFSSDWAGYNFIPFLVEIADAPGGAEAGKHVVLSTQAYGVGGFVSWDFAGAVLPAGRWWLSVSATGGYELYRQVFLHRANEGAPNGSEHYIHNPGGGFGMGTGVVPASRWYDTRADLAFFLNIGLDYDCNTNGIPDDCDLARGIAQDCNLNDLLDACEISGGTAHDVNLNGIPDACEADSDGDGACNTCELCPNDPAKTVPGLCGCGVADTDSDGDGKADCIDGCPGDKNKANPGICGCGVADTDSDADGIPDCNDQCPNEQDGDADGDGVLNCKELCPYDSAKTAPGNCGCGVVETDTDGDGTADCADRCPDDPNKAAPGTCGCGVPETDTDGDGVPDCIDGTPEGAAQAVEISGPDTLLIGTQGQYTAAVLFADGSRMDVSDRVAWRVLDIVVQSGRGGLSAGDAIDANGLLAVSAERTVETMLSVLATFDDGPTNLQGAKLIEVLLEEPAEPPVTEPTRNDNGSSAVDGSNSPGASATGTASRSPCGAGLLMPMALGLLGAGVLKLARTRRVR